MDDPIPTAPLIPPGPKPPSVPLRSPQVTPVAVPDKPVVIRTMKDDLQEIKSGHQVTPAPLPVPKVQPQTKTTPKELNGKSIVIPPGAGKKSSKHLGLKIGLIVVLVLIVLSGGGVWLYSRKIVPLVPAYNTPQPPKDISAMIPNTAASVVEYRASTQILADNINQFWASQRASQPSLDTALKGDPRFLLANQSVQDMYYVILPNESSPYLIFAHNDASAPLVAQVDQANILDQNGWYIVHGSPISNYSQALTAGTFAGTNALKVNTDSPYALYVYVNQDVFTQAVTSLANKKLTSFVKTASLWSDLASTNGQIIFHGALASTAPVNQQKIDATILNSVPASATYIWLGSDLSADIKQIGTNASLIDQTLINQPSVNQFIAQLNKPYAYYQQPQAVGVADIGIVMTLPQTTPPLVTGDKGIESALPAILPLLVGQKAGVPLTFSDAAYNGVNLKYVNIPGSTQALDYAIVDNNLLMATSKNAMLELIDTVQSNQPNILLSGAISTAAQNVSNNAQSASGSIGVISGNLPFIPGFTTADKSSFSLAFQYLDATTISLSGTLNQSPVAPSATPTASVQPTNLP